MHVCMYMRVCICVYVYVYIYICVCVYVCTYADPILIQLNVRQSDPRPSKRMPIQSSSI